MRLRDNFPVLGSNAGPITVPYAANRCARPREIGD